jgi:thioredoxin 1
VVCVALGLIAIKWYSGSRAATDKEVQRGSFQTAGQVKQFTLGNYQQDVMVASEKRPVLMEFFTRTCPVCKRMDPVLNDVARELGERASIGVVNPEERKLFQTFNIRMVPTIYVIRNREVYKSYIGFVSKEELVKDLLQLGSVGRTEGT